MTFFDTDPDGAERYAQMMRQAEGAIELLAAHKAMIDRCRFLLDQGQIDAETRKFLCDFLATAKSLTNTDKLSRWVGFAQGVLWARGLLDINMERDFSRPLYRPAYDKLGYDSATKDVNHE